VFGNVRLRRASDQGFFIGRSGLEEIQLGLRRSLCGVGADTNVFDLYRLSDCRHAARSALAPPLPPKSRSHSRYQLAGENREDVVVAVEPWLERLASSGLSRILVKHG
jgi:hypothetical protein